MWLGTTVGRKKVHIDELRTLERSRGPLTVETFSRRVESGRGRLLISFSGTSFIFSLGRQGQGILESPTDFTDNGWSSEWQISPSRTVPRLDDTVTCPWHGVEHEFGSGTQGGVNYRYVGVTSSVLGRNSLLFSTNDRDKLVVSKTGKAAKGHVIEEWPGFRCESWKRTRFVAGESAHRRYS